MSALQSEDTIEISSDSFVLSHLKFTISNFFVNEECAEKLPNLNTIRTGFITQISKWTSGNCYANLLNCLSQVYVLLVYKSRVNF